MRTIRFLPVFLLLSACPPPGIPVEPDGPDAADAPREPTLAELWVTDGVLGPAPRRVRPVVETPREPEDDRPTLPPRPIEVLIGTAGDGREIPSGLARDPDEAARLQEEYLDQLGYWEFCEEAPRECEERPSRPRAPRLPHLVVNFPYESWGDLGTNVHLLALTHDLKPAARADVYLDGRHVGKADSHGTFVFRQGPRPEDATEQEGTLTVVHQGTARTIVYDAYPRTASFDDAVVYVHTDRGVYRPGQTVHVRTIAWRLRGDYVPLADRQVELELLAPDRRIVGGGSLRTDAWGVGTADLPVPRNMAEGRYTLIARHEGEEAEAEVRIERFVPPAIEIRHDLPRFLTPDTRSFPVEIRLGAFGGGRFDDGRVEVSIEVSGGVVHEDARDVEGEGPHTFDLTPALERIRAAVGGAGASDDQRIVVRIAVTDRWDRRDEVRKYVRWTANPYRAVIELDRTRYAVGDPVIAMVRVVDLEDVPIRDRKVRLACEGLRPDLAERTDVGGIARFRFRAPQDPDREEEEEGEEEEDFGYDLFAADQEFYVECEAFLEDVEAAVASADLTIAPPLPMRSAVPDTRVIEGQEVVVEIAFPLDVTPIEDVVHADVTDSSGAIVDSFLVPIRRGGGRPSARGTFRPRSWGSGLLSLFCLGRRGNDIGLLTDGQNLAVRPDRTLRVTLGGLPARAAPGDDVRVTVTVAGPDGTPRDAVAGVAVVDDAVLSMLDPFERAPEDRFYNPDRKVLASTGAQTLTWPVVQRTWGRERYDICWPPLFGYHRGEAPRPRRRPMMRSSAASGVFMSGSGIGGYGSFSLSGVGDAGSASVAGFSAMAPSIRLGAAPAVDAGTRVAEVVQPAAPAGETPPPRLILRTDFDETSLWIPRLETSGGTAAFEARLPDSITVQNVAVLASDRQGGIGLGRGTIPVRQELYVRGDLPAALTEGDEIRVPVAVRNLGDGPRTARVSLASADLDVAGEPQTLTVPAGETRAATFTVRARRPGPAAWEARAESDALVDVERRDLFVRPRGEPTRAEDEGLAYRDHPWTTRFTLGAGDRWRVVRLGVAFPTAMPALQDVEALLEDGYFGPSPAASGALAAAAAYEYLERAGTLDEARRTRYRAFLAELSAAIVAAQLPDGSWGWFWDRRGTPLVTAHALDALLALRELDFPVSERTLIDAGRYLAGRFERREMLDVRDIAVWEGNDQRVRLQATALVFDVMARTFEVVRDPGVKPILDRLVVRLGEAIDDGETDPLVLAHTVLGLRAIEPVLEIDPARSGRVAAAIDRLARTDDLAHWEPGWFDAYGGRVEAAWAVLLAVESSGDEARYETVRRRAIRFLLSTRPAWGRWHNARGTAYAVRALLHVDPTPPDERGELVVRVDGAEHRRVAVDSADLFAGALALRSIELDDLGPGEHVVEVSYDGAVRARAALEVERWTDAAAAAGDAAAIEIERTLPEAIRAGEPAILRFRVAAPESLGPIRLRQPLPAGARIVRDSLESAVSRGAVGSWEQDGDTLQVGLPPGDSVFEIRIELPHPGEVTLPAARAIAEQRSDAIATAEDARVAVGAGR